MIVAVTAQRLWCISQKYLLFPLPDKSRLQLANWQTTLHRWFLGALSISFNLLVV